MSVGKVIIDNATEFTELINSTSPVLAEKISSLITIFKAVGIAFLIYFVYLVLKWILNFRQRSRVKRIEKKVEEIDKKLDKIIKKFEKPKKEKEKK